MHRLDDETALSVLGEGIHTALRKVAQSDQAGIAHSAISRMPNKEWDACLRWWLSSLETMGITLAKLDESNNVTGPQAGQRPNVLLEAARVWLALERQGWDEPGHAEAHGAAYDKLVAAIDAES